ncbi:phosphotransacetylase family protein [Synechocystis sp. LKSZ1]|uniref:phosphotransacetylase family protein n=1 Tax=Synechocystis sp. LKSZ1 TaxID=3144951 RepID=UPI00336BDE7B
MANVAQCLLVGSIEAYSGKSGIILGLAQQLQQQGLAIAYGKPIGTCLSNSSIQQEEADVNFVAQALGLSAAQVRPPLLFLEAHSIAQRLQGQDTTDYTTALQDAVGSLAADIVLLEGPGTLWEGSLFNLSFLNLAKTLSASILLVARYHSPLIVDGLIKAQQELGSHLLGVVINDVPAEARASAETLVKPFLEQQGIAVLGLLPQDDLLRSVSVRELAHQLGAKVLCREDRLDLMVESLTIGAMNVNSALEYFRRGENKAVVTGGDRTDLQLAALETSTSCLILTGHIPPQPLIISRAEDLEIPILSVNLDTLKTVEIVDQAFGNTRLQEPIKVQCIQRLMAEHFDLARFLERFQA